MVNSVSIDTAMYVLLAQHAGYRTPTQIARFTQLSETTVKRACSQYGIGALLPANPTLGEELAHHYLTQQYRRAPHSLDDIATYIDRHLEVVASNTPVLTRELLQGTKLDLHDAKHIRASLRLPNATGRRAPRK